MTCFPVNHYYSTNFPFGDGIDWASRDTSGFAAMMTGSREKDDEQIRVFPLLYGYHPSPTRWPGINVIPVLARDNAGKTSGTSALIKVESQLR